MKDKSLANKVIVVTGGTQGVGEAVAIGAARDGATGVVICGRHADHGQRVVEELRSAGAQGVFVPCELADPAQCQAVIAACEREFGRVDGLVNAAADTNRGTLESTTVEFWDYQFAVNVRAPFLLIQAAVKLMQREEISGSIVNVLSVASYCGAPNLVSYSTTKGALATLTKNLANSLRQSRIRVNGIHLGWTDTPNEAVVQQKQGSDADWLQQAEQKSPFGRLLKPEDVAELCVYLLSDRSGILTGSNIDYSQRVMGNFPPER